MMLKLGDIRNGHDRDLDPNCWPARSHLHFAGNAEASMAQVEEQKIRERAYELWEQAGKPKGKQEHFWLEAERQLEEGRIAHELKTPDNL
jgi:Protein of unknown function (DUF2934)